MADLNVTKEGPETEINRKLVFVHIFEEKENENHRY
jgi:hypothetical protein